MGTDLRPPVLITGVAGFLGSHLAERLVERGHPVVGVDLFTDYYSRSQKEANLSGLRDHPAFRLEEADICTMDLLPLVKKAHWVFHQAAQPGVRGSWDAEFAVYTRNNILGTQRILDACRGTDIARFVFASSSSVYGNIPEGETTEDAPPRPLSPYGVTKLAAEKLVEVYFKEFGLPTVSLRYFTVCGPRQRPDMAFHKILRALFMDEPFSLYGDGSQQRDFTYVADAVNANILAAEKGVPGAVYNIGGGCPTALSDTIAILEKVAGRKARLRKFPRAEGDPMRTAASLVRAADQLGYKPEVGIAEALAAEAEWFTGPCGPLALERAKS